MSQAYFNHYMQTASQFAKLGFGKHTPWIDLVNSLEHDGLGHTTDHLDRASWLDGLLQRWQFPAPSEPAPLASLGQLRETLHRGAEDLAASGTLDKETLQKINAAVSVPMRRVLRQDQNGFALEEIPDGANWSWIQAQIAASFAHMLVDGTMRRMKFCGDERCRWIFVDETKGRTRRWCNERTCGNRNRVRRARAKAAS
jgi:predicted RNA-binding Zn ribbon-like protein